MTQPIGPIAVQAPVPSILTTARDRSRDGFGESAPVTPGLDDRGDGALPASSASWRNGISWTPLSCQPSGAWAQCPEADSVKDEAVDTGGPVEVMPFWFYTPLSCEWALEPDELDTAARALNDTHAAYAVARALWFGEGLPAANPTLRNTATDVSVGGGTADLDDAVALLLATYETATGGNGGAVLHIPGLALTGALGGVPGGSFIARPEGNVYRGPLGSLISPGPGYPYGASAAGADGFGPETAPDVYAGTAGDELWVYITGPVEYALGESIELSPTPGLVSRLNVHQVLAERQAIVRFDPCSVFAAKAHATVTLEGS